ncbi:23064_t:CDS:2 [Dentiscutata erythropus]|uniref:23064_t:CDS:1 n=1 Tax=Dentiscutata erythropus TaxID=1348616 RepID=A0A9N8VK21_9GLOM|nr:23064_t:CDS:2 [Dentiscutata erythropus]
MTLIYTQSHVIRPLDRACTENFNIPPRSSSASPEKKSSEIIPRMCSATPPSTSAYNDKMYDLPSIVAPCPKKALYAYAGHLSNNNFAPGSPQAENPWGLSSVQEDMEEDHLILDNAVDLFEAMSDDALACAELLEIMGNSSCGSSSPVSQSASPDSVHRVNSTSPIIKADQDDKKDIANENGHNSIPYSGAIEIDHMKQKPESRPMRLPVDNFHLIFGSSPITRAHNPLPMDSHFSPSKRHHHHQAQPYPSRPALHQAANIQKRLCDTVSNVQVGGGSLDDSVQPPLSKASKAAILLRISEGGRRRSLSVGSAGLKPGKLINRV